MHCSSSADAASSQTKTHRTMAVGMAVVMLFLAVTWARAASPGFHIQHATTRLVDGVHLLYARIVFDFSDDVVEAMENGVAITVAIESEVLRVARGWDRTVGRVQARYRIQVHTLSRQYVVRNLSTGETTTYPDLAEMTSALGDIENFPLLDDHVLEDGQTYRVRLRAYLEIESLPTPLRLLAYLKSSWRLASDWTTWRLQR